MRAPADTGRQVARGHQEADQLVRNSENGTQPACQVATPDKPPPASGGLAGAVLIGARAHRVAPSSARRRAVASVAGETGWLAPGCWSWAGAGSELPLRDCSKAGARAWWWRVERGWHVLRKMNPFCRSLQLVAGGLRSGQAAAVAPFRAGYANTRLGSVQSPRFPPRLAHPALPDPTAPSWWSRVCRRRVGGRG